MTEPPDIVQGIQSAYSDEDILRKFMNLLGCKLQYMYDFFPHNAPDHVKVPLFESMMVELKRTFNSLQTMLKKKIHLHIGNYQLLVVEYTFKALLEYRRKRLPDEFLPKVKLEDCDEFRCILEHIRRSNEQDQKGNKPSHNREEDLRGDSTLN